MVMADYVRHEVFIKVKQHHGGNQLVSLEISGLEVQNWLIDMFLHVLPTEAAARLWDHILESQGEVRFVWSQWLTKKCQRPERMKDLRGLDIQRVL